MDPNTPNPQSLPPLGGVPAGMPAPAQAAYDPYSVPAQYQQPMQGQPMQMPPQQQQGMPMPANPAAVYPQPTNPAAMYGPPPAAAGPTVGNVMPPAGPTRPPVKTNPNSTQNTLQIAEVRDGIVIMNDGSFRCVVMVKSINFDLMSPEEREGVEYGYQGFLDSLYFDVQIFIRSQKVDIRPYIEKLDKIRSEHDNMLLALLMEDYINYMHDIAMQTNIMDKKFYVVIPFTTQVGVQQALAPSKNFFSGLTSLFGNSEQHVVINEADLAKAKDELRNRVQAVLGGLQQCGVQGLPLDTQELIELYYDTYNPDTATRQQLAGFDELIAPVITKGQGQAPQPNLDRELQQ